MLGLPTGGPAQSMKTLTIARLGTSVGHCSRLQTMGGRRSGKEERPGRAASSNAGDTDRANALGSATDATGEGIGVTKAQAPITQQSGSTPWLPPAPLTE
jgi:hypothetical protein